MLNINIIMGGPSAEHEVSLRTGREILLHIDKSKYRLRAVVVNHKREFFHTAIDGAIPSLEELAQPSAAAGFHGPLKPAASCEIWHHCDLALLALHGSFGEDGVIQGFLETVGIPYTGSGVLASAAGMDKIASKHIFEQNGLDTPPYTIWGPNHPEVTVEAIARDHGFPLFVKCPQSGSSRLMGRADDRAALQVLLSEYEREADEILIETTVTGDEYSCPVLEKPDGTLQALPPILIRPLKSAFFDFEAKYTTGASEEIVPAPCSEELTRRLQQASLIAHRSLGCRGITRTDIIVQDDRLYVLEINTLPGMTSASLVPKAFAATSGTYAGLLDILIQTALRRNDTP